MRTFNARRGRLTANERAQLEGLAPRFSLPPGPFDQRAAFGRVAPVVIDVGSGFGHAACAYAVEHPGHDVVAVDVHTRGVAHLLATLARCGPANVRVVEGDAVELMADRLGRATVAGLHLFFPDPWPKRAHHGRRFVRPDLIGLVVDRLAPGAHLLVATDHQGYADQARKVLDAQPELHGGPVGRPSWRPRAGFEAKAVAAARTVIDLRYAKSAAAVENPDPGSTEG